MRTIYLTVGLIWINLACWGSAQEGRDPRSHEKSDKTLASRPVASDSLSARALDLIRQAGEAQEDAERLALLRQLDQNPDQESPLSAQLRLLIAAVEEWVHTKRLDRWPTLFRNDDLVIHPDSPLYFIAQFYRARVLTWQTLESGDIWKHEEKRLDNLGEARELFQAASYAFPGNRVIRMYLGEPIAPERLFAPVAGAPEWAVYQRESLERLTDIIHWWIDHRMLENGEYGGGWGDDCEMWRWWTPVLIAFDDPPAAAAQRRFSTALLAQPHMEGGYTHKMSDVEHTAEDTADAITPMMFLDPDSEEWRGRSQRLGELTRALWTGVNERGFLQFKSTYFTVNEVSTESRKACDTVYHPRTVQPTLLYWQRTGDAELTRHFTRWMDTWVEATARAERGKPAGIIPSAIHWPDGGIGGL